MYENDKLKVMEIWLTKRMIRTSGIEFSKTNEAVLDEIDERRTVMNATLKKKIKLIVYLLKRNRHNRGRRNL